MEIKGKIVKTFPLDKGVSKSGKEWKKASVIIETEGQYPKHILIANFKDAEKFASLGVGTQANFNIELESKEWTNKTTGKTSWFTEVTCWKWEVSVSVPTVAPQAKEQPTDDFPF